MSASNRRGLQSLRRALAAPGKRRPKRAQSSKAAQLPLSRANCPAYLAKRAQRVGQLARGAAVFLVVRLAGGTGSHCWRMFGGDGAALSLASSHARKGTESAA